MHTTNNSSYHSIQCQLVNQKSSVLTESLSCCVFLCPMLSLQRLVVCSMKFLLMKSSMSGCYYKRQALHGLVATGQGSQVKPYTYNYYVSKHNNCVSTHNNYTYLSPHNKLFIVGGERGHWQTWQVVRKHCRCTSATSCRTIM